MLSLALCALLWRCVRWARCFLARPGAVHHRCPLKPFLNDITRLSKSFTRTRLVQNLGSLISLSARKLSRSFTRKLILLLFCSGTVSVRLGSALKVSSTEVRMRFSGKVLGGGLCPTSSCVFYFGFRYLFVLFFFPLRLIYGEES